MNRLVRLGLIALVVGVMALPSLASAAPLLLSGYEIVVIDNASQQPKQQVLATFRDTKRKFKGKRIGLPEEG